MKYPGWLDLPGSRRNIQFFHETREPLQIPAGLVTTELRRGRGSFPRHEPFYAKY